MSDLISRQAAKDALAKLVPYAICDTSTESYTNGLTDAYNLICQLPSVQPEWKRGKWMRISDEIFADRFKCSECGNEPPIEDFDWWLSNYCPHCGADMRGEINE